MWNSLFRIFAKALGWLKVETKTLAEKSKVDSKKSVSCYT
jgi:hypothetical protein